MVKLPSDGLRLNASKSESLLVRVSLNAQGHECTHRNFLEVWKTQLPIEGVSDHQNFSAHSAAGPRQTS